MPYVSVIVPVYNVENYLEKCLNSLVNQTLKNIEIIVVNDGSKDNSQSIIDSFSKKYKNIKSYKKDNGGLSSARNFGIKNASGKYVGFVDSDDYVEPEMFEIMYNKAEKGDFDVVTCNINYVYDNRIEKVKTSIKTNACTKDEIKKIMLDIYPTACNKIFKKSLFDHVLFKENIWYEDVEFLYRVFPFIDSMSYVDGYEYNYLQRGGTISSTYNDKVFDYIDNWNGILDFYKNNGFYDSYKKEIEYSYVRYLYATFIKAASKFRDREDFLNAINCAIKNVKDNFPNYRKNRYFYHSLKGIYLVFFNKLVAIIVFRRFK